MQQQSDAVGNLSHAGTRWRDKACNAYDSKRTSIATSETRVQKQPAANALRQLPESDHVNGATITVPLSSSRPTMNTFLVPIDRDREGAPASRDKCMTKTTAEVKDSAANACQNSAKCVHLFHKARAEAPPAGSRMTANPSHTSHPTPGRLQHRGRHALIPWLSGVYQ